MKLNKRITAYFLCVVLVLSTTFVACGKKDIKDTNKKPTSAPTKEATVSPEPTAEPTKPNTPIEVEKQSVLTLESDDAFDQFLNELYIKLISADEFSLHFKLQNPENYGIEASSSFGDINAMFNEEFVKDIKDNLDKFDYEKLNEQQKIKYDLLQYEVTNFDNLNEDDAYYIFSLSQNSNFISNLQQSFTEFSIQEEKDAELFCSLLEKLPKVLENQKGFINDKIAAGKSITQAMYSYSIKLAQDWLSSTPEENIIYISFKCNLDESGLSNDKKDEYLKKAAKTIEDSMIPAINDYIEFVNGLNKSVVTDAGAASHPGGKKYYEALLEAYLGTGMTPDKVFKYAESRFDEYLEVLMNASAEHPLIVSTLGLTKSKFSDDPEEVMQALVKCASEELPVVGTPKWILSYLDKKQEVDSITAYYLPPQLDNIGRRVIRINGSNITDSVNLFVTLAHEGFPGHLYQNEYDFTQKEYQEIDCALTYLSYQEGWAMYVEKLAYGWCVDNELKAELLNVNNVLNYVIVSLVDIGVNYYGWSLKDTMNWLQKKGLEPGLAESVYSIVVSDPAIYPAYGIGYLLMEDTVNCLKDTGLSDKECFKKILDVGSSPYTVLWKYLGIDPLKSYK